MTSETTPKKRLELPTAEQRRRLSELLRSWVDCDEDEARDQRETLEYLKKVLDEDRFSTRKLFR